MPDYFLFYCINPCKSGEIQIFGDFALTIIDLCRQENIACKFAHKVKKNGKLTAQNKVIFIKMATRLHSFRFGRNSKDIKLYIAKFLQKLVAESFISKKNLSTVDHSNL